MGQLPRRFGRLTLLRRLARGGMGEVYLASTGGIEGAERPCVVKIIRSEHSTDRSFRARFLDETRIQAQLQHPGVAQILEASTTDSDCPYAVVEYVEGRHLGEVMTRCVQLGVKLEWPDAVALAISLGDALAHVHERTDASGRPLEIAHRDLSPQNVMVGYAGDLKLIDFGTARGENRRCRTVAGIVFAKPGYVAPEVANQTPGGAPADLYAFGIMLWELVAGRRFLQGDPVEHQAAVARGEKNPPSIASDVGAPREIDLVIARLTACAIEDRFESARAAVAALVAVLRAAPSLADGDRSVRGRIAHLMQRLYPAEPARSRADFARRVAQAAQFEPKTHGVPEPSPTLPKATDEAAAGLLSGTRYRIVKTIGRGGMGEVFEAHHVDLGRPVALKLLPEEAHTSPEARQRFRTEARAIARLEHPGLVKLHDFGVSAEGRFYYAMELLRGEALDRRLARGRLPWREAVEIASAAADALGAAHRAGVVHRDITPSNLFLTENGGVKLLDFGVARFVGDASNEGPSIDGSAAPAVVGTPEYLAPEQAAGAAADARSDLYALGAVLYEMLTGELPHGASEGESVPVAALLTAKITRTPEAPRVRTPSADIPAKLNRMVVRALSREPERRFSSAEEFRQALDSILVGTPERQKLPVRLYVAAAAASAALGFTVVFGAATVTRAAVPAAEAQAEHVAAGPGLDDDSGPVPSVPSDSAVEPTGGETNAAELPDSRLVEGVPSTPIDDIDEAAADVENDAEPVAETAEASAADPVLDQIADALRVVDQGKRIVGYNRLKRLARRYPERAEAQRGWSISAVEVKAWGDALRGARKWAELDSSPEARLHLARMQKATVRGDAVKTLESLLADHPNYEEAERLLHEYRRLAQR